MGALCSVQPAGKGETAEGLYVDFSMMGEDSTACVRFPAGEAYDDIVFGRLHVLLLELLEKFRVDDNWFAGSSRRVGPLRADGGEHHLDSTSPHFTMVYLGICVHLVAGLECSGWC